MASAGIGEFRKQIAMLAKRECCDLFPLWISEIVSARDAKAG